MLKIRFYNKSNKYTLDMEPFQNGSIKQKIHEARAYAEAHGDIAGWTIYEWVGGCWLPYQPFNFTTTQVFNRKQLV
ncbi:hypothetical protein [Caproiciproducens sp. LBM24188]